MLVRLLQPKNAATPMEVTLPPAGIELAPHPAIKVFLPGLLKQFPSL